MRPRRPAVATRALRRILLIYPPTTMFCQGERKRVVFPIGLGYLAASLERAGFEAHLLDAALGDWRREEPVGEGAIRFGMSLEAIRQAIAACAPDAVGVGVFSSTQAENGHAVCRLAKEVDAGILTVMGGAYATAETQACLADAHVDFAVVGEGERALVELLRDPSHYPDGVASAPLLADLEALPWPARHRVDFGAYSDVPDYVLTQRKPYAGLFSSRGCPFGCTFCFSHRIHGRRFRPRSPDNVLAEIEHLVDRYGTREVQFWDDNLTFDRDRALEIFGAIRRRGFDLTWTTPSGLSVATLDRELLVAMKDSGCCGLIIAPESGNERVLRDVMRKPIRLEQTEAVVRILAELDMPVGAFWMLGLPGETKQEMIDTVEFAARLKSIHPGLYSSFSIFTPFRGTPLYDVCVRKGYLRQTDLTAMKYSVGSIDTEEFSHEWVQELRHKGWLRANHADSEAALQSTWVPQAE